MAQRESISGDQFESSQTSRNKQNNVTEFSSQPAKKDRSSARRGSSTSTGTTSAAAAPARSLYDQAKETAGQAYEAVTDKAAIKLDEQKSTLSGGLTAVAESVRQASENLGSSKTESGLAEAAAKYTNTAAKKLEDVAGYFETRGVREMARDLERFARRNPAVFFGAAFGLGLLAARFLKSSVPGNDAMGARRELGASAGRKLPTSTPKSDSPNLAAKTE